MTKLERDLEQVFVDAAMAEGLEFGDPLGTFDEAMQTLECSFVDVAFAEADDFTETACTPEHHA